MTESEADFMRRVQMHATKRGDRLFRNNTALGWVGRMVIRSEGRVVLDDARPLHAGLCVGSSDLIGWTKRTVTPDMVGETVAIFTGIETKSDKGVVQAEQDIFIKVVNANGGIAGVARTLGDVEEIISLVEH